MKRAILCCLLCISLLPIGGCVFEDDAIKTSDLNDYSSIKEKMEYHMKIFPSTIPEEADVVDFYFYRGNCQTQAYLELNFETPEDLMLYIENFKQTIGEQDLYMLPNHKIDHYTDLFVISQSAFGGGENNRIYWYDFSDGLPNGLYVVTSYSTKDLSVVITYFSGDNTIRYYPRYFNRFGITIKDEEHRVIIPNGESNLK